MLELQHGFSIDLLSLFPEDFSTAHMYCNHHAPDEPTWPTCTYHEQSLPSVSGLNYKENLCNETSYIYTISYLILKISETLASQVISLKVSRSNDFNPQSQLFSRASVAANAVNAVQLKFYYTNVTVGSPPQPLALLIDRGSSDVWVPSVHSGGTCGAKGGLCVVGTFNEKKSSSYVEVSTDFWTQY